MILLLKEDSDFIRRVLLPFAESQYFLTKVAIAEAKNSYHKKSVKETDITKKEEALQRYKNRIDEIAADYKKDHDVFEKCFSLLQNGSDLGSKKNE